MALGTPTMHTKGQDTANSTGYATASVAFTSGREYALAFCTNRSGATPDSPTVSGSTSGTWTSVDGNIFDPAAAAQRSRVGIRRFRAASSFSEAISFTFANACTGLLWIMAEFTGADAASPVIQTANGRGDAAITATLALAAKTTGSLFLGAFGTDTQPTVFLAGGTFTLLDQISRSDVAQSLCLVYNTADEDPSVTFAIADWGGGAYELRAAATTGLLLKLMNS